MIVEVKALELYLLTGLIVLLSIMHLIFYIDLKKSISELRQSESRTTLNSIANEPSPVDTLVSSVPHRLVYQQL